MECLVEYSITKIFDNYSPNYKYPGARFNKVVQPTLSLNLNSELTRPDMENSEFCGFRMAELC